jgi:uncharacterized protein (TIGR00369 family)
MNAATAPLPDYGPMTLVDPFEVHVGPVFEKSTQNGRYFAILIGANHINRRGILHGGMLATFADLALGAAAMDAAPGATCVTLSMQMQYLKSARAGDIVKVRPRLLRRTRTLLFIRGDFAVADDVIFVAMSTWKLLGAER